jgi:hypothetical protein
MGQAVLMCWLLGSVSASSGSSLVREEVDLIEVNHFHDELGRHVYDQVVFYGWSAAAGDYHVRGWCLLDDPARWPRRNKGSGLYQVIWHDRDQRVQRQIVSRHYTETWTQVDPERVNKRLLDEKHRTSLVRAPARLPRQDVASVTNAPNQVPQKTR